MKEGGTLKNNEQLCNLDWHLVLVYLRQAEVMISQGKSMPDVLRALDVTGNTYSLGQWIRVHSHLHPAMAGKAWRQNSLYRAGQPMGERLQREL